MVENVTQKLRLAGFSEVMTRCLNLVCPVGVPLPWHTATAPEGFIILDGSTVNVADYPDLFAVYGTTWGGDGVTTFILPDYRGRTPYGKTASGTGSTLNAAIGGTGLNVTVPAHYHSVGDLSVVAAGVPNAVELSNGGSDSGVVMSATNNHLAWANTYSSHSHSLSGHVGAIASGNNGDDGTVTSGTLPGIIANWMTRF